MNELEISTLIWHNGNIKPKEEFFPTFEFNFLFSNNFVEYYYTSGTEILFFNDTLSYLQSLLIFNQIDSILFADKSGENFKNETKRLLIRNKCYKTTRCYILFSRSSDTGILKEFIFLVPDTQLFGIEKTIKKTFVSNQFFKPKGIIMNLSGLKNELKKIFRLEIENKKADDCIILNQDQNIAETYTGNIFLIESEIVYTPSLNAGCTPQLLRNIMIALLKQHNFQVIEKDDLQVEDLFNANEVVVTGETGIFSLKGFEYKRYFDKVRKNLISEIMKTCRD